VCNGNGRGGERLHRMNEGDGIKTERGKKGGRRPVPDLTVKSPSRLVIEKSSEK